MLWVYIVGAAVVFLGVSAFFGAPYVPSRKRDLKKLFDEMAPITEKDVVLDFGSGDGLVLREASRRGAKAVGYEIHPLFVAVARMLSRRDPRVIVRWVNAWRTPFPEDVTLVYAFSVGRDGRKLANKVLHEASRLRRPIVLVCYGNPLPGRKHARKVGAYYGYRFDPLHSSEA